MYLNTFNCIMDTFFSVHCLHILCLTAHSDMFYEVSTSDNIDHLLFFSANICYGKVTHTVSMFLNQSLSMNGSFIYRY